MLSKEELIPKRAILFNAWIPKIGVMLESVTVYRDMIGYFEPDFEESVKAAGYEYDGGGWVGKKGGDDILEVTTGEEWIFIDQKDVVLLQFTGMKDKKAGTAIYDGAILLSESGLNPVEVYWGVFKGRLKGYPPQIDDTFEMTGWMCRNIKTGVTGELDDSICGELLGNIYQHPSLLKSPDQ